MEDETRWLAFGKIGQFIHTHTRSHALAHTLTHAHTPAVAPHQHKQYYIPDNLGLIHSLLLSQIMWSRKAFSYFSSNIFLTAASSTVVMGIWGVLGPREEMMQPTTAALMTLYCLHFNTFIKLLITLQLFQLNASCSVSQCKYPIVCNRISRIPNKYTAVHYLHKSTGAKSNQSDVIIVHS